MALHLFANKTYLGIPGTPLESATGNSCKFAENLARHVQSDFSFTANQSSFSKFPVHRLQQIQTNELHHITENGITRSIHNQTAQTKYSCQEDNPSDLDDLMNPSHSKNGRMRLKKSIKLFQARATPILKHHSLSLTEQFYRAITQIDARHIVTLTIGGSDQHDIKVPIRTDDLLFTLKWGSLHNGKLGFDLIPRTTGLVLVDRFNNQSTLSPNTVYFIEHNEQFELTTERGTESFAIPDPLHVKSEIAVIESAQRFFDVANSDLEHDAKSKFKRVIRQFHPDLHGVESTKQFVEAQNLWKKLKQYKGWK